MMGRALGQRVGPQRIHRADAFAEAMERRRCEKNWTMADLAEKSLVSLRTIKSIANRDGSGGRIGTRVQTKLNRALGCQLWQLAREIEDERARAAVKKGRRAK